MLRIPVIRGVIARRILVNFRVRPEVAARILPPPFRPRLVRDWAMAGICLIRLESIRPPLLPAALGVSSENAAHRIAVEWDEGALRNQGVFIPRRDTGSLLPRLAGGRVFPGVHHPARFRISQTGDRIEVEMRSRDGRAFVQVAARIAGEWPGGSVFATLEEASAFFEVGSRGWSPDPRTGALEGMDLRTSSWKVEPLRVESVQSSFFADSETFPPGSAEPDCALLMRGIPHEWHALGRLHPWNPRRSRQGRSRCAFFDNP